MLILVVGLLLWLFQIVLLDPFYRGVKTAEIKGHRRIGGALSGGRGHGCPGAGILPEHGNQHCGDGRGGPGAFRLEGQRESLRAGRTVPFRSNLSEIFNQVNLQGGRQLSVDRSPFVNQDGSRDEVILYITITRTPSGYNRMVMLESAITPVDSIKDTLQVQVTTLTVVMAVLGVLLALLIARRISRPLTDINEGAKVLAKGNYAIRFQEHGAREVRELARHLELRRRGAFQGGGSAAGFAGKRLP